MSWLVLREPTGPTLLAYDAQTDEVAYEVTLDIATSDSRGGSITWTSHPVERDAPATDHGIRDQLTLSITGKMTRTPLTYEAINGEPDPERFDNALDDIEAIRDERLRVDVISGQRVYLGYRIASATISRGQDTGQAAEVAIDLVQLREVSARDEKVPPRKTAKKPATTKTDAGTASTDADASATESESRRKSALERAREAAASAIPIPPTMPPGI